MYRASIGNIIRHLLFRQDDVLFLMNISILDGDVEHRISMPVVMVQNISVNDRRHSGEHLLELTIVRLTGEYRMSLWFPVVSVASLETESTGECNGKVSFSVN